MSLCRPLSTSIARSHYSRSALISRSHLVLHPAFRYPHRQLGIRYQSSNSNSSPSDPKSSLPAAKQQLKEPLGTRIWKKVKHEAQHYWHGSKLLVSEVRISSKLQWKILHGEALTRRERRQASSCPIASSFPIYLLVIIISLSARRKICCV
jgi:LETM1 and EF-hand domain-containing protein 1